MSKAKVLRRDQKAERKAKFEADKASGEPMFYGGYHNFNETFTMEPVQISDVSEPKEN